MPPAAQASLNPVATTHIHEIYIKATPAAIWDAITNPSGTRSTATAARRSTNSSRAANSRAIANEQMRTFGLPEVVVDGEVIEANPPYKLVQTYRFLFNEAHRKEGFTRITWEIVQTGAGFCRLTVTHEIPASAPMMRGAVTSNFSTAGRWWMELDPQRPQVAARDRQDDVVDRPGRALPECRSPIHALPSGVARDRTLRGSRSTGDANDQRLVKVKPGAREDLTDSTTAPGWRASRLARRWQGERRSVALVAAHFGLRKAQVTSRAALRPARQLVHARGLTMITLYTFGPFFGLPDASPFVMKGEMLLKLSKLEYQTNTKGFTKAPKGKLPYIDDNGTIVADSTLIRLYLEQKYGIDFDRGLSPRERGIAWAAEKMLEDHLYWVLVYWRWMNDANFERGPANFFKRAPAIIRPFVDGMVRGKVRTQPACARHRPPQRSRDDRHGESRVRCAVADSGRQPIPHGQRALRRGRHRVRVHRRLAVDDSSNRRCTPRRAPCRISIAYRDRMMAEFYPWLRSEATDEDSTTFVRVARLLALQISLAAFADGPRRNPRRLSGAASTGRASR